MELLGLARGTTAVSAGCAGGAGLLGRHSRSWWFIQSMGFSKTVLVHVRGAGGCARNDTVCG